MADEAECGAGGVERLGDDDAADDGGMDFGWSVVGEEMVASGVAPAPVEDEAKEQDVEPIDEKRDAVVNVFGEQRGGERGEADGAEEGDVNPGKIAVGAGEIVELSLLADPEDAIGHYAHQKVEPLRP